MIDFCVHGNKPSDSGKGWKCLDLLGVLLVCQDFCSTELVGWLVIYEVGYS